MRTKHCTCELCSEDAIYEQGVAEGRRLERERGVEVEIDDCLNSKQILLRCPEPLTRVLRGYAILIPLEDGGTT